jgi:hypothetical protein
MYGRQPCNQIQCSNACTSSELLDKVRNQSTLITCCLQQSQSQSDRDADDILGQPFFPLPGPADPTLLERPKLLSVSTPAPAVNAETLPLKTTYLSTVGASISAVVVSSFKSTRASVLSLLSQVKAAKKGNEGNKQSDDQIFVDSDGRTQRFWCTLDGLASFLPFSRPSCLILSSSMT